MKSPQTWDDVHKAKRWGTCAEPAMARFIMRTFGDRRGPPPKVLDLGCGAGAQTVWLAQNGFLADGMDISEMAIQRAKDWADRLNLHAIRFRRADATSLPFPDNYYDAVVDVGCLQHVVDDRAKAIGEVGRILKTEGWLFSMFASDDHSIAAFGGLPVLPFCKDDDDSIRLWADEAKLDRSRVTDRGMIIAHNLIYARKKSQ
jgi:ubiquinone/menaquinone biosynthesis C-methylase UbiE